MRQKFFFYPFLVLLIINSATAQTGQWTTLNSTGSPTARHECTYVKAGNKFYLLGGRGNLPVESYDPQTDSWATEANSMPMQMHHFQPVEYNGKIYVIGAFTGNCCHETPVANVYIFDPVTKQWSTGPQIPANRRRGAAGCVLYNNKFYVVCGIIDGHSSGWVSWLDVFDPQTNTWTQLPDAPRERDHFFATLANGKIYCIGGRRSGFNGNLFGYTTAEVDVYDIASNSWSTLPPSSNIPTQRAACATALVGNEILAIGGEGAQIAYDKTEALNISNHTWRTLAPLNQSRHATTAIVYNDKVYIACGAGTRGGSNELSSQEVFSFSGSGNLDCNGVAGGTALLDDCQICSGGNTGHTANSDKDDCGVCWGDNTSCTCDLQVTGCVLVQAGTSNDIMPLADGAVINKSITTSFNIKATLCTSPVGSVIFFVNNTQARIENSAPYALAGDNNGNYSTWNADTGNYTIQATPYSGANGGGTQGFGKTISIRIIDRVVDCNGVQNGIACDDTDSCTENEVCSNGICAGTAIVCPDDGNPCTSGVCNNGTCVHSNNIEPCSDNDACTDNDVCANGSCIGTPVVCIASDQCHDAGVCVNGVCTNPIKADNTPCNDNIACTADDECIAGICEGTSRICSLNIKVFLGGPYDSLTGLMSDTLRKGGYIPLTEPYTALNLISGSFPTIGPGGGETMDTSVLLNSGGNAVVDWMYIQLRSKNDNTQVLASRSALLLRNGSVVDVDGVSPVSFQEVAADDYYIVVRHRNHLGAMTLNPVSLSSSPAAIDFTDPATPTYGTDAQDSEGGKNVLWSGNVVYNGNVKYSGPDNDRDPILVEIGGVVPTAVTYGYKTEDVNLDGAVKYSGPANDRDPILVNIGGVVPTAVRVEQVP